MKTKFNLPDGRRQEYYDMKHRWIKGSIRFIDWHNYQKQFYS